VKVPLGTMANPFCTKPHDPFLKDNFFSKLSTIRQQSPPESAYANSPKRETVLSLTLKDGQTPCQESAISLKCLKFYSGDNYGLGWGPPLSTITYHEHGSLRFTFTVVFRIRDPGTDLCLLSVFNFDIHPCLEAPQDSVVLANHLAVSCRKRNNFRIRDLFSKTI
jgi:hypothetical protein